MFSHRLDRRTNQSGLVFVISLFVLSAIPCSSFAAEEQTAPASISEATPTDGEGMMQRPCKKKMGMGRYEKGDMGGKKHQGEHAGHRKCGGTASWKASLTDAQRKEIKALKVAHMKITLPLKMKIKAAKAELVALATADPVDQAAVEAKIDDLLWHQRLKLIEKYRFMAAKRQLLTPEQRLDFDMAAMRRVKHGKKGGHDRH
jgi:Spy/CpxP family protein refolding chaperone